ncbi:MAG TPA: C4-type zinc ribbon domain-containing protein [Candidatus Hydrothermia bacterium]|nr:hypothetical protein [Candidatus Hydrothermae bacterium]MDD3649467.1 C4-type zinc ribbon domain-containing protein [Candidatus Hydrothermia bacterium]MDD5572844.1 C4-type zinc ribbon domain-containing protein [Candidatus Hydrothermia bacterium]HOK22814.1 C4-type zinc ribbon domain-containing protein [Candidatus Hydrothermia bacterium]HOL23523.1 C4-type zinc ribbon domain-containing protein [Candidatus Hydrothermia bacterium]
MNDLLKQLIEIQNIEAEIDKLKIRKSALPKEIRDLEAEIEKCKTEKERIINELKKEEVRLMELEVDLKEIQEKIRTYQEKSRQVKTNEEYRAMLSQIEHADMEKRRKEEEVISQMEVIERLKVETPKQAEELEKKVAELEGLLVEMNEELKSLEERFEHNQKKKQVLLEKLPEKERQIYEKLQSRAGPYVICEVMKMKSTKGQSEYVCTGCYGVLPLSFVQDLRSKLDYARCPNCGRIVYYHEDV